MSQECPQGAEVSERRQTFCFVVDGTPFEHGHPLITAGEIMDRAGIPREVGLIHVLPDGTHRVVDDEEIVNLAKLAGKLKECPDFVRG